MNWRLSRKEKVFHATHVEHFSSDIIEVDGHPEFKGHILHKVPGANFQSLKGHMKRYPDHIELFTGMSS